MQLVCDHFQPGTLMFAGKIDYSLCLWNNEIEGLCCQSKGNECESLLKQENKCTDKKLGHLVPVLGGRRFSLCSESQWFINDCRTAFMSSYSLHDWNQFCICVQNTILVDVDWCIIRKYFTLNTVDCLSLKQNIFAYLLTAMYFQFLKALSV